MLLFSFHLGIFQDEQLVVLRHQANWEGLLWAMPSCAGGLPTSTARCYSTSCTRRQGAAMDRSLLRYVFYTGVKINMEFKVCSKYLQMGDNLLRQEIILDERVWNCKDSIPP